MLASGSGLAWGICACNCVRREDFSGQEELYLGKNILESEVGHEISYTKGR